MDQLVNKVKVSQSVKIQPGALPYEVKTVTFYVGEQGPFTLTYRLTDYNATTVEADIMKEVTALRQIGAIPPG